jgi:predicted RNA-binding protein with PUA-like domain
MAQKNLPVNDSNPAEVCENYNHRMKFWLMKCEPSAYSIGDLERDGTSSWEGVRNYQARNFMRDEMKAGDRVLFYASNADPSGVTGVAEISREAYPDLFARTKGQVLRREGHGGEPDLVHGGHPLRDKVPHIVSLDKLKWRPVSIVWSSRRARGCRSSP